MGARWEPTHANPCAGGPGGSTGTSKANAAPKQAATAARALREPLQRQEGRTTHANRVERRRLAGVVAVALSESDTRAKLIDPALHANGWTEELIKREETAGAIDLLDGRAYRRARGRIDYTLRVRIHPETQPVAVALIEAKAEHLPAAHGLEQAKEYAAACKRLNLLYAFSSNGHLFVEHDRVTGRTAEPRPLTEFPGPRELQARYETAQGFSLAAPAAAPLVTPYRGGEASRRYYQDAAIRAVLEKVARGEKRALLSLATGAGKTFIAVHLLRRIQDAGQLRRALFVCDRDELRGQATNALQNVFGSDAAAVESGKPQKNARILIATYQTLDVDREEGSASFLTTHYPENYFSHIVIDECHRSAWGKWRAVLDRNPGAVQIGLTATPRRIVVAERTPETAQDEAIAADNVHHFGEPAYEYDMGQGIEDGYLAACEVVLRDIFLDRQLANERETGVRRDNLGGKQLTDARTGESVNEEEAQPLYKASSFEGRLVLPDRVQAMCQDLFDHLLATGGPEQKTIIFCARDDHADRVAATMGNLYSAWCEKTGATMLDDYAFKCTAKAGTAKHTLADLKGSSRHHFVATTVDLLTTGVDVPVVRNIVFFKYVRSPIAFHQMVGRGTRLDVGTGKLMFRVYDYTGATLLFGQDFMTKAPADAKGPKPPPPPPDPILQATGFDVRVTDAGRLIVTNVDGKAVLVTVEEYKERLAEVLLREAADLGQFRERWVEQSERRDLLGRLPDAGRAPALVQALDKMDAYDLYDVLADLGYGSAPRTREQRAEAFTYKHAGWLAGLPAVTAATLKALASQFTRAGTDGLETPQVFQTPEVLRAGGLAALKMLGNAAEVLRETKRRLFAA